jgi:hypothetical protein
MEEKREQEEGCGETESDCTTPKVGQETCGGQGEEARCE